MRKQSLVSLNKSIQQIQAEIKQAKGIELRALTKHLTQVQGFYRNVLWQFVDETVQAGGDKDLVAFTSDLLTSESGAIKSDITSSRKSIRNLEEQIAAVKLDFGIGGQDKRAALEDKHTKEHKRLEKIYSDLVKNAQSIELIGGDSNQDRSIVIPLIINQADMLSGLIGLENDKLIKLERKLSAVSSESNIGKKLLNDIRAQNLLLQIDANRLKTMATLLDDLGLDSSLYQKVVIKTGTSLSTSLFNRKVATELFTEWWLQTKKWLSKQAPDLIGKIVTFLAVILIAYLFAVLLRRLLSGLFRKNFPHMSELAKRFIVSTSSKLVVVIGLLLALSNIGIQIGPILAGLGIMGFIVGFAMQDTLANFASGMMILIYRPFDVGDKIQSAGVKGKVSKMNLVSTTIFTSENHQLTLPNKKIWGDIIHNITSQPLQRLDLLFSVPFNANSDTVKEIIADVVERCSNVIKDKPWSVRINELGEAEVRFLARFWVETDDIYEAQWNISEGVKKRFDDEGISLIIVEAAKS